MNCSLLAGLFMTGLSLAQQVEEPEKADVDADGLPDLWELQHFGSLERFDGQGDPDGDGVINLDEWRNGTDPNKA